MLKSDLIATIGVRTERIRGIDNSIAEYLQIIDELRAERAEHVETLVSARKEIDCVLASISPKEPITLHNVSENHQNNVDIPIEKAGFDQKTSSYFAKATPIKTLGDITAMTKNKFRENHSQVLLTHVEDVLRKHGLSFAIEAQVAA